MHENPTHTTAGQLHAGQTIAIRTTSGERQIVRVQYAEPYTDADRQPMVVLVLAPVGGGEPIHRRYSRDLDIRIAADDEIERAHDEVLRHRVVRGLAALSHLVNSDPMRIRPYGVHLSFHLRQGDVSALAGRLGLELEPYGSKNKQVVWSASGDADNPVTVTFFGEPAPVVVPAEQPQEWPQAEEAVTFVVTVTDEERAAIRADAEASRAATLAYREERRRRAVDLVNEVEVRRAQQAGE